MSGTELSYSTSPLGGGRGGGHRVRRGGPVLTRPASESRAALPRLLQHPPSPGWSQSLFGAPFMVPPLGSAAVSA